MAHSERPHFREFFVILFIGSFYNERQVISDGWNGNRLGSEDNFKVFIIRRHKGGGGRGLPKTRQEARSSEKTKGKKFV